MWKLINCGTYFWYIRTDRKYHHCYKPYGNKSIKIRIGRASPTVLQRYDGKTTLECYLPRMTMKNRKKEIERLQENTLTKKVRAIIETIKKTRRYEKDSKS